MSTVLDTLIMGRTVDDLANDTDRTYIAYTDLNRVEQACTLLIGLLHVNIRTKEWGIEDFRVGTGMACLLGNIRALRTAYSTKTSTPITPAKITYSNVYQANDIEQILENLGDMYDSMVNGQRRLSFKPGAKVIGNRR